MTNREIAKQIFEQLEKNHINLYHDISKEDFEKELNKFLEMADNLDDIHFDAGMSRLFSLFKDAHTKYFVKSPFVDVSIKYIDGKFYYYDTISQICEEIVSVNGIDFNEVYEKLKSIEQYEFDTWANHLIKNHIRGLKYLKMIDCDNKDNPNQIEYTLASGKEIIAKPSDIVSKSNKPNYSFDYYDGYLIITYRKCAEIDGYPFIQFVEDIKNSKKELPKNCLIDLRGNTGGSSEIIHPLIDWLEENKIKTYVLMNEEVFSSGTFALFYLKKYFDATFIGTEAGQGGCRYGQQKPLEVDNCNFGCSEKKFDFTNKCDERLKKYFSIDHPIVPDIYLPEKIEDVKLGIDGQLRDALKIIKKELDISKEIL